MDSSVALINLATTRDISGDVLDEQGRFRILPAAYWSTTTTAERARFGNQHGIYSFPTDELVEHLKNVIGERSAIEIGSGNGVLAEALDIPATDNRMQEMTKYAKIYAREKQKPVSYGPNVIKCPAHEAVRRFKPQVVIGCWVTHLYDPMRHWAGGNEIGVDEEDILRNCEEYVFVGNTAVHKPKKIWKYEHEIEHPSFVYSRAHNGSREFVATWHGAVLRSTS